MQENINIYFGEFEACLVGHESVVNVILFSKENLFSMIIILNSVYLYLELPEKVLLRRESLSIYNDFVLISAHSRAWWQF